MKPLSAVILCFTLVGCATPEPRIVTKEVKVAVPTPCKPTLGQRPALMTKDQVKVALASAPTFDDKTKIITEQLLLYIGWTPIVEAGLKGCAGVPNNN
jgi:hypothetical protein